MSENIILAEAAEEGKIYLSAGMRYKIKIIKKHTFAEEETGKITCSSITVESEKYPGKQMNISGGTELIEYDDAMHIPAHNDEPVFEAPAASVNNTENQPAENQPAVAAEPVSGGKPAKAKKEKKVRVPGAPKMSDIIIPMLAAGKSNEEIAQEVMKSFPDKKEKQLISMIKGPYTLNYQRRAANGNIPKADTVEAPQPVATDPTV